MTWKEKLGAQIPADLGQEIDIYETQMELRKLGKIDAKLFAETRLRRGAYGQRYDNGQRFDGFQTQHLKYPTELTKGPDTAWDAPGMMRIKIPFGGLNARQLEVLADVAEEYADSILHITTRQDFQLHFVHIEDTPTLMRRLAAVGITTREACGNSVRNVTACPLSGICRTEAFDVTPYAKALTYFLLGHPDTQDFGRKFKPAFSGCEDEACGLVNMHDFGGIAQVRDGKHGFKVYVGGGLGAVPYQAKVLADFVPVEELLPTAQAIARVFARLGEKQNRARARIKFLVDKLGIEEFKRLVAEERKILPPDPRWTQFPVVEEKPVGRVTSRGAASGDAAYKVWLETNVYRQRQTGFATVTVYCPIGDITSTQARQLADLVRKYSGDSVRTSVEQNLLIRWVSEADLPALFTDLKKIGLGEQGAGTILDMTACPGTDTCKLGIASSRGLARELRSQLAGKFFTLDEAVKGLRIKMSGCFNSCGQHHIADIGFYGNSRTIANRKVPHFQVLLGGKWRNNGGSYGLAIGSVPSKNVPKVVERITERFVKDRQASESLQDFYARIGKAESRKMIEDLMVVPAYEKDPSFYSDWGDPREFSMGDIGMGECAGEVISALQFELGAAERLNFEAQLAHEAGDFAKADKLAYDSMLQAARGLVHEQWLDVPTDPATVAKEFRGRFIDKPLFSPVLAAYFFHRHDIPPAKHTGESTHRLIEEAQLFIEGAHTCGDKLQQQKVAARAAVLKK